jgi:hypothetical protein
VARRGADEPGLRLLEEAQIFEWIAGGGLSIVQGQLGGRSALGEAKLITTVAATIDLLEAQIAALGALHG